ncbi:RING finger and SPRY domain-containing protein 1-like isoform X2 [Danaus plexippus]|uniref:RING finger and SPRY domain-containing protein 1 n=2 Tax=Danaus plexippus TaxID=13037 RepID=A0A212F9K9_DANPL|nr:RING finger and SPRY domain-containing protein 1-like isoform X2 [Danaus plexippus]XP_032527725.1 RING finger and SPRY domain-containing protein 1-like isoform X2 [Danaus plexippus]XP_061382008.1 RING finger and SPRY domain-containing protein 1-like isoform X2 [Danaus plexippus]OWR50417.1 RING finger and SPRY domain-containing protein 1 [Danaus plexippus plexippus]
MGGCCCSKEVQEEAAHVPDLQETNGSVTETQTRQTKFVDPKVVDQLVLDMLTVAASRTDTDEESPVSLVKLHVIADKEEGWIQMVSSMVNVIPLEDPFGPTAISILLDDCPLPSKESVIKVTQLFDLSHERATSEDLNIRTERNICVILGCIAEKLVGPNSVAILTEDTLQYLLAFLTNEEEPRIVLFALIALEKFAHTTENKLIIKSRLEKNEEHPLLKLEKHNHSDNFVWRQVGFCANWALDNLFTIEGRTLSYMLEDMSQINALLNCHDVSEYLQMSSNGLEARCDSYSFESVRCTFQVDNGCWYYEATIITSGVMQIGWATKNSHYLNDEGYGIGDDLYSLSYDGCRRLVWYNAKPVPISQLPAWKPGDILGCLIDLNRKEVVFSLNGRKLYPCKEIFDTTRYGFFAAASFMAYQQCMFNFGLEKFKYPPTDRKFSAFNDHAHLTDDEKKVIPRRIYLEQLRCSSVREDSCQLCFDETASCVLEPCGHRGFCSVCTSQLKDCPLCRADIISIKRQDT